MSNNAQPNQPVPSQELLRGVRVLEVSSRLSGAYAGRLLASMGAHVDRVGPAIELASPASAAEQTVAWVHDGKSLVAGQPAPADAVADVDLVILETGADPEWVAWGLGVVAAANAQASPPVVVRLAGAMVNGEPIPSDSLTTGAWASMSWAIGDADKAPLTLPFDLADFQLALYGTAAGLAALLADPQAKELRHVDVAGRDVMAYYVGMITANFLPYERPWLRDGARPPGSAGVYPASIFPSSDGHVVLMCRNYKEWHALLGAMGNPAWSKDPKFDDPRVVARLHSDEADSHLIPWIGAQTSDELVKLGRANGLAVAPILSVREALEEPQFAFRDFFGHDATGTRSATVPWELSQAGAADSPRQWSVSGRHAEPTRLLEGLRVLDLSWVWSGPLTTSILGDLGAEILKVEHSGHMDTGRHRGRARRNGVEVEGPEHEATPYFNQMNHGKRSITLDMKRDEARAILLDLVEQCDVVVENMRPGVLKRLGLSYDDLAARNPAVVMLSMSMAGQEGPLNSMKGYAGIMAAMSGLESLIGYDKENIVGSLSPALGDPNAAGHALCSLLGSLVRRRRTGLGCWIDLSQIEALMCVMPAPIAASQVDADVEVPVNTHPLFAPYGHFPASGDDRWVALAVRSDEQWAALADLARGSSWAGDEKWRTAEGRRAGRADLEGKLARWTAGQDRDTLTAALLQRGIAAAPLASFEEMTNSAWVESRELKVQVQHRYLGETDLFVAPFFYGGRPVGRAVPAPMLGADTDDILGELLGMEPSRIKELHEQDVLI